MVIESLDGPELETKVLLIPLPYHLHKDVVGWGVEGSKRVVIAEVYNTLLVIMEWLVTKKLG